MCESLSKTVFSARSARLCKHQVRAASVVAIAVPALFWVKSLISLTLAELDSWATSKAGKDVKNYVNNTLLITLITLITMLITLITLITMLITPC